MRVLEALIKVPDQGLELVFKPEVKSFKNGRATYSVEKTSQGLKISVKAKDFTAFKTVMLSVLKLLEMFFNTKALIEDFNKEGGIHG